MTITTQSGTTPTPATTAAGASTTPNALGSLSSNFNNFLNLLMTQLKNQDPSQPTDASTFTNQLVQFSSVEQQINTNSNLQTLIQATQSNTVLQSSSLVGKQVSVKSDHLALQNGSATAQFTAPQAEVVNISVQSASGAKILQATAEAQAGSNQWTWNGKNQEGVQVADGAYKITVTDPSETAISTTTTGTVTGVSRSSTGVSVSLGGLTQDVGTIQSVSNN